MESIKETRFQNISEIPIHWTVKFGTNVKIGENVVIDPGCHIGSNVFIGHNTVLRSNVRIGDNSVIGHLVMIEADTMIGQHVTIQSQCHITKLAVIEDHVFFGPKAMCINTRNISHGRSYEAKLEGPRICFGARIGAGAIIMPGIVIGKNVMLGAGSVATKSIPSEEVWFGNPAKCIRACKQEEVLKR